jgi:hypothetical protein
MLCYCFSRNTLSDMPIHTSLYTGSCLVVVRSLHCSIHLSKYSTHVLYIHFIPPSVCHTLHQVLHNHFSSRTSLNFKCMKLWVRHPFKHFFFFLGGGGGPSLSSSEFWHPSFLWHTKSQPPNSNYLTWHRQWKYNITIMYFLTINFLHFSPNKICEQIKKQHRVKKTWHPTRFLKTYMDGNFGVLGRGHVQGKAKHMVALL